jgi:hypothetical protein
MVASSSGQASVRLTVTNFARTESDTYFDGLAARAGGRLPSRRRVMR